MSELERARERWVEGFGAFASGIEEPEPWRGRRREALARFAELGLPHTRLEEWRYTSLSGLAKHAFATPDPAPATVTRERIETVSFPVFACSLYVFVNGRYAPELSAPRALSGEIRVESLAELRREDDARLAAELGQRVDAKQHSLAALNEAYGEDGAVLFVPRGADLHQPVHLAFVSTGSRPAASHPRVLVVAGEGSRATVIQDHVSIDGGVHFTNAVTELSVGANASLRHVLLQREEPGTFHVSNLGARVERSGRLSTHTLTLGGRLVRNDLAVLLADEGAECGLDGLFLGTDDQLVDNHTLVDHAMPHGTSRELYKGILGGRSRGVFRGRVVVRPDAQKTAATQSNPNLLLADGAEVDTKPQLEIHADDVKCSHGSTIGQLDPDALFYLRSRGIGHRQALDLLTRGFAAEILERLEVPALGDAVGELLLARLDEAARRQER